MAAKTVAPKCADGGNGVIKVRVRNGDIPVTQGAVYIYQDYSEDRCAEEYSAEQLRDLYEKKGGNLKFVDRLCLNEDGVATRPNLPAGNYVVWLPYKLTKKNYIYATEVDEADIDFVDIDLGFKLKMEINAIGDDFNPTAYPIRAGGLVEADITIGSESAFLFDKKSGPKISLDAKNGWSFLTGTGQTLSKSIPVQDGRVRAIKSVSSVGQIAENLFDINVRNERESESETLRVPQLVQYSSAEQQVTPVSSNNFTVSLKRSSAEPNGPMSFFVRLLDSSRAVEFTAYRAFIDKVLSPQAAQEAEKLPGGAKLKRMQEELSDYGVGGYELLKTATDAFLLSRCCVTNDKWPLPYTYNATLSGYANTNSGEWLKLFTNFLGNNRLPYINRVIETAFPEYQLPDINATEPFTTNPFSVDVLLRSRVNNPCFLELIWNYWHEEGMLVQSINAVSRRFQNLRAPGERDPLAHVEIDPLRPLNNILWGYVEEERDRLSIMRRAYEYQHQYGLELYGKAIANLRPADSRSKFLEAFHNLLNKCADYYRAKQDTTVDPDGYPMLHAIQELNLILAHGAHNQFGDLAWTSRAEMLMQEWILARPEMRDFLQSRAMVPNKESWMPQVDTMKTMQGWTDVAVTHFRDLGVFGEQILLTIRWYNWYDITNEDEAKSWADLLRPHIQSYIHSYRAVTGVDLSATDGVDYTMPSVLLRKRLATQHAPR